jgi:ferric-dicitrate binding protein FerR (iron transport regulator)
MKTEVPYDLIAKYFAGQCNENEVNEVEKWKKAGTENESEFRQLKKAWENTALAEYIINTEAALSKVSSQISTKKETQSIFMKSWMRIAA